MSRRNAAAVWVVTVVLSCSSLRARAADEFVFHREEVMGTALELRVRADSRNAAAAAEERVLREIERLSRILSGYDPTSELSRWQRAPKVPAHVPAELFEMLRAADAWRSRSGGAFDPRVESLTRLWSSCTRLDRTPTGDELDRARALIQPAAWHLDTARGIATRLSDCPITLSAIAKGFIVERACAAADGPGRGIHGLLLNVGGDLCARGTGVWPIAIAPARGDSEATEPAGWIEVHDRSVATSGSAHRGLRIAGRWYSHIFDPRTGRPADHVAGATVIAPRGADADALATICNVLPIEDSLRLVASLEGAECLIVAADSHAFRSAGWRQFERPLPVAVFAVDEPARLAPNKDKTASSNSWDQAFELAVEFEINRPGGQTRAYRRPYVVLWVEDAEGITVRTLVLWVSLGGSGPERWLPDLSKWYAGDETHTTTQRKNLVFTFARPTRPPGKYTATWDGKDDAGKLVPRGTYTVHLEAAREHGTHQLISQKVKIEDKPFTEEIKGNVEIRSARIDYRRKGAAR
jgi:thiamine biosynthesis lipoprotein ApbE